MIPEVNIDRYKDIRTFARASTNPFYEDNLHTVQSLFGKSLAAHRGHYSALELQVELLGTIIASDSARRTYRRYKGLIREAIAGLAAKEATLQRMKQAQSRLRDMEDAETSA